RTSGHRRRARPRSWPRMATASASRSEPRWTRPSASSSSKPWPRKTTTRPAPPSGWASASKPCKISSRSTQPAARARRRETRAAARFVFHSLFPAPQGEFPLRALPKLKLKHKLTLSIAVLVLVVVVAVNLVFLASSVHQQLQDTFEHANFLAQEIYSELGQELDAAYQQGAMPAAPDALNQFFQGRAQSPALASLFSAGIGYNGTIRDVALVNPQGVVVVDSNPLLEGQIQPRRRLMSDILDSGIWRQVQTVMGPEAIYSVSLATEVEQHPLGTITVGVDTVLLRQALFARLHQLLLYGGLIVLIATALAWALSDLALAPLNAISAQLDRLRAPSAAAAVAGPEPGDEFGRVQSKIQRLGEEIADARQVYSALQENVGQLLQGLDE